MEMEVDHELSLEYDAPQYIDFLNLTEHENPDAWFDERESDDEGVRPSLTSFNDQSSNFEQATSALSAAMMAAHEDMETSSSPPLTETKTESEKTPKSKIPSSDRILRSTVKANVTYSEIDSEEQQLKMVQLQKVQKSANKRSISETTQLEGSAKKRPKMDLKKNLVCIPHTPAMIRRMKQKSSEKKLKPESVELGKIEQLRKETNSHIRINQNYMKKALGPHQLILKSRVNPTTTKAFKFATDSRIKQHDMQTRNDVSENAKPFTAQLRKHSPSPTPAPKGPTKPVPFKCASAATQASKRRSQSDTEYQSVAAFTMNFQTKTPERFRQGRRRTNSCNNASAPVVKLTLTCPKTPNLTTKQRVRPSNAEGFQHQEERDIEVMKNYKFKAQEFDHNIVAKDGMYGVRPLKKHKLTEVQPFHFQAEERAAMKHMVKDSADKPTTSATTSRRSVPTSSGTGVSDQLSLYDRSKLRRSFKEKKLKEVIHAEEKAREFHARPLPSFDVPQLPDVQRKLPTKCQPFKMKGELITADKMQKFQDKVRKEEQQLKEQATFKAQSSQVLQDAPFQPRPTKKPLTAIQAFNLHTDARSKKREEFDLQVQKELAQKEQQKYLLQQQQEKEDTKAIKELRRSAVHTARPVPKYKEFEVKPSDMPLTEPHTPQFATTKRARSLSTKMAFK